MVRIVFGSDLDREGSLQVTARTLGETLAQIEGLEAEDVRAFVDGVDVDRLEGRATPVGDEDTVLFTAW